MTLKLAFASTAVAVGLALSAGSANAASPAPLTLLKDLTARASTVDHVQYRPHCRKWRHICANRWPGLGWRFRRCMRLHGC
ncbi:MAG: glycosyl hydrolase family 5 [Hyphomicrobiaceae bacterium]